nr:hypothetical protein [Tanacetum cinerariifolium]
MRVHLLIHLEADSYAKGGNVTLVCGSSATIEMQGEDSDSDEVEDIDDDMTRYMANPNCAGGVINDASLQEYEDYNGYDDFKYFVNDLNEEHC